MKLKSKFIRKNRVLAAVFMLVMAAGFFVLLNKDAKAACVNATRGPQTCQISDIQVQLDTYINGNSTADNFVRVGLDGGMTVKGVIKLRSPETLAIGQTLLDFTASDDLPIEGFGLGIMPKSSTVYTCSEDYKSGSIFTLGAGSRTGYVTCNYPSDLQASRRIGAVVSRNSVLYENVFSIGPSQLMELGLATEGRQSIYVCPAMFYNSWARENQITFNSGCKEIFVQVYKTQALAAEADKSGRPADLPGYGSTVSSPTSGTVDPSNPLLGFINGFIGMILGLIQEFIFLVFYWLLAPLMQAMLSIRTYTDTFAGVIYPGWEIVRNVCNIFFIVAFIAIGLATLFRVESYQFRHLLVQLVIAALLVNFSLVIGQVILGVADTIQNQFLPNNVEVIRSLAKDLMLGYRSQVYGVNFTQQGYFANTVKPLFFLALALGSFGVFAAITVFLVIRIVALWILLMLSPVAYAARVLPSTHNLSSQWWQYFLKYAFFTPIMAFFLNLAALIAVKQNGNPVLGRILYDPGLLGDSNLASFVVSVASNLLLLVFLLVGLKVADQLGIYGAHAITDIAQKGILAPFAATAWGAKTGWRIFQRYKRDKTAEWSQEGQPLRKKIAFTALNLGSVSKAFKEDFEKNYQRAEHYAEAGGLDVKRQIPGFRERGMPSELAEAKLHHIQEISKERPYSGFEELEVQKALQYKALAKTSPKYKDIFANQLLQLMENKGGNALLHEEKYEWSREAVNAYLASLVEDGVLSEQMAGELNASISRIGYDTKQPVLMEGVNRHGVHPGLFETVKDAQGVWQIRGGDDFQRVQLFAIDKLNQLIDTDAEIGRQYREKTTKVNERGERVPMDEKEFKFADQKFRSELKGKIVEQLTTSDEKKKGEFTTRFQTEFENLGINTHDYGNYEKWDKSMGQRNANLMKKTNAAQKLAEVHWNSMVHEINGEVRLTDTALVDLFDIKETEIFQAGRGIQEKVLAGLEEALRNRPRMIEDFKHKIIEDYKRNGIKPPALDDSGLTEMATKKALDVEAITIASRQGADAARKFRKEMGIVPAEPKSTPPPSQSH